MARVLAERSGVKIPMARTNDPDVPPKHTKIVRVGICRTKFGQVNMKQMMSWPHQVSDVMSQGDSTNAF